MSQLRLLIVGYVWPEPTSSAAGCRMMQLIELFESLQYEIIFATAAQKSGFEFPLESKGIATKEIKLNCESFSSWVKELQPSVVLFDRFMMEEQFGWRVAEAAPNALRILDTEDLHFLRSARADAHKNKQALSSLMRNSDISKREIAAILRCDASLIISQFEMDLLTQQFGVSPNVLLYLPLFVEPIIKKTKRFEDRKDFVFIGNFYHEPNWQAVKLLKTSIWPQIRQGLPKAKLLVYGAYATKKVYDLNQEKEGFLVLGRAEDVNETLQEARICLAPLFIGAGLKGKLLEAMKAGSPSITTSIGAEGIAGSKDWPGFVADEAAEFSRAAIDLYENKTAWLKAQSKGFEILESGFARQSFYPGFCEKLDYLLNQLSQHREQHFMGSLLLHHTLASTKYMSKWIEAKNKG